MRADRQRSVSLAELRAAVETPLSAEESERIDELRTWFTRAYPTAAARLRYVSRAYRAWMRLAPPGGAPRDAR